MSISEKSVEVAFSAISGNWSGLRTGLEPSLGRALREKAVWVDESDCIGCRYCAHVASNTFVMVPGTVSCRAVRQDGDSIDRIQEAIDTCPVDCIHWVDFEHRDDRRDMSYVNTLVLL